MIENMKFPKIRYCQFTDAWEHHKFEEVLKVNSGKDYKHLNEGDIPVYGTGGYMLSVDDKLSDVDGVGIGRKGTIDKPQYLKAPFWTVDTLFFMTPFVNYDLKFLFAMSQSIVWKKMDESTGVPSLSKSAIENLSKNFPSLKEQIKIGSFFKQLDETINLQQLKYEKTINMKKVLLEKMFPKSGENKPEIRFKEFTDDWTLCKLSNVKDVRDGTHESPQYFQKGHPLVTSKNLKESGLDMTETSLISTNDFLAINKRSKVDIGDILFGMIGTIGNPVIVERDDFAIKNVALIKNGGDVSNIFLIQLLKSSVFDEYIRNENVGNTQKFLGLSKIRDFKFHVPSFNEQEKIGNFFKQLECSIKLHRLELEKVKNIKKAFLEKMFA